MKKFLIYIFSFASVVALFPKHSLAQQDAMYTQYMFNPMAINPGYAGSRDAISAVLHHRSQWVGFDGAPSTQTLAVHSPIGETGLAGGVNMSLDRIGAFSNMMAFGTVAYHLKAGPGKLSLGIRGGIYNSRLDNNAFSFETQGDFTDQGGVVSSAVPSFDAGLYYYTNEWFVGASVNHLTKHNFQFENVPTATGTFLERHFTLMGGAAIEMNENIVLKPSARVQYVAGAPLSFDANFSVLLKKKLWLGASYRFNSSVALIAEYNITPALRLGYAYDLATTKLINYNSGSHEVFIGYDFRFKEKEIVSPRYL